VEASSLPAAGLSTSRFPRRKFRGLRRGTQFSPSLGSSPARFSRPGDALRVPPGNDALPSLPEAFKRKSCPAGASKEGNPGLVPGEPNTAASAGAGAGRGEVCRHRPVSSLPVAFLFTDGCACVRACAQHAHRPRPPWSGAEVPQTEGAGTAGPPAASRGNLRQQPVPFLCLPYLLFLNIIKVIKTAPFGSFKLPQRRSLGFFSSFFFPLSRSLPAPWRCAGARRQPRGGGREPGRSRPHRRDRPRGSGGLLGPAVTSPSGLCPPREPPSAHGSTGATLWGGRACLGIRSHYQWELKWAVNHRAPRACFISDCWGLGGNMYMYVCIHMQQQGQVRRFFTETPIERVS